jgi:uncharacterized protein
MTDPRIMILLRQARWQARPEQFALIGLDPRERLVLARILPGISAPFMQMIVEPGTLTLVLPEADWRTLRPAFPNARVQAPFRAITFALDLPDDLIGFLAAASRALAEAGVPILAICGYSKDHILVREQHLTMALAALEALADS